MEVELKWETEAEYTGVAVKPAVSVNNLAKADDKVEVTVTTESSYVNCGTGYNAVASTTLGGTSAANYKLTIDNPTKTTTFAIVKKKVTVKADNQSKVYDNNKITDTGLTATVTDSKGDAITTGFAFVGSGDYTLSVGEERM